MRRRALGAAACCAAAGAALHLSRCQTKDKLPPHILQRHVHKPHVAYPDWDKEWDHRSLSPRDISDALGLPTPPTAVEEVKQAIRRLFAEPGGTLTPEQVEERIGKADDLDALLARALYAARGRKRHFLLVRHGQYDEDGQGDEQKVLTPLGRRQAEQTGRRIAEALHPALTTAGRGPKAVRVHVSTMTRAKETRDLILGQLPTDSFDAKEPTVLLVEGSPPVHNLPEPLYPPEAVHTSLMEAAFRSLFRRSPLAPPPRPPATVNSHGETGGAAAIADDCVSTPLPRDEYEIVVCHANVIRYMTLRALQLPPEAWFRVHPKNCSITHLVVCPNGEVDLFALGDVGHLSIEDNTFNMAAKYPFK